MKYVFEALVTICLLFILPRSLMAGVTLSSEVGAMLYNEHDPQLNSFPLSIDVFSNGWFPETELSYSFDFRLGTHDYFQDNEEFELIEAFIEYPLFGGDLGVGRLLLPWGRADQVNPTDSLVTRNYQFRTFEDSNQKIGNDGITYRRSFDFIDIEVVWLLNAESSTLPSIDFLNEVNYDKNYQSDNFAVRGDHSSNRFDSGISYYQGINLMPSYSFEPAGNPVATLVNYGVRRLGLDAAINLGKSTVRVELAYSNPLDIESKEKNSLDGRPKEDIQAVIGIDGKVFNGWYVNFQILGQWLLEEYPSSRDNRPEIDAIVSAQRLVNKQPENELFGITWRVSNTFLQDTLLLELSGIAYTRDQGSLWRPRIEYQVDDSNTITLGGDQYFGDENGVLGILQPNNSVWFIQWKLNKSLF